MINLLILILSLTPPIFLLILTYLFYSKKRNLEAILLFATFIHESLLVSLPCIYSLFSDFDNEKALRFIVTDLDLVSVLGYENLYIFFFMLPLLIFLRLYKFNEVKRIAISHINIYPFLAFVTLLGIIVYSYQIINRPTIEQIVDSYSQSGLVGSNKFISLITITFEHAAIISASVLSVKAKNDIYSKKYQILGTLLLILSIVIVITTGVRGRVVWVAEFIILVSLFKKNYRPIFLMILLGLMFIPLNNILVNQIRPISEEIAKEGGITNDAIVNITKTIYKGITEEDSPSESSPNILSVLAERAQAPRNSVALIKEYDAGRKPGLNIYTGAIFYFIPRFIIPRPVLGSPNDNFKDAAIFKVMDLNYSYNSFITMGPLLASAHAYWEGGILGIVFISLISSSIWICIFIMAYKKPIYMGLIICLLMGCALLIDGFISMFTPLYALISMFWKTVIPFLLISYAYFKMKSIRFSIYR